MLEMLEKLINEHGSSTILKERLELFSDKYNHLEEKNNQLSSRNQELEKEVKEAKEEIKRLQELISTQSQANTPPEIEDIELSILKLMFEDNNGFTSYSIAQQFNIGIGYAEHYLNALLEKEFITVSRSMMTDNTYYISPEGRVFIVKNT